MSAGCIVVVAGLVFALVKVWKGVRIVPQGELAPQRLADLLRGLTREALLAMANRARALAAPRAAQRVADEIEALTGGFSYKKFLNIKQVRKSVFVS